MKRSKKRQALFIIIFFLLGGLSLFWLGGRQVLPAAALTVPTRTPPPPPPGGGGGGGGGRPSPTPIPPTSTPTQAVTLAPTPVDGFVTPETCGTPLFQASNGTVNVREFPSTTSEIVGRMVFLETRGISGQFASDPWWLVVLPDGTQGWVADSAGTIYGSTAGLPLLDSDQNQVSEFAWRATPNPLCPTLTPSPTPSATSTPSPTPTSTLTVIPSATATAAATAPAATSEPSPTPTENPATATVIPEPSATAEAITAAEMVVPSDPDSEPGGGGVNFILVGGAALLLAGFGVYFVQRRGGSPTG